MGINCMPADICVAGFRFFSVITTRFNTVHRIFFQTHLCSFYIFAV